MAEQGTIRADQIEGLAELIRDQVRTAVQAEIRPDLQNVDEVRRSPAGTLIRLEGKIDALKTEMDQCFDALKTEMDQRFHAVDQRFDALSTEINHRFDAQDRRLNLFQWIIILMFSLLIAMAGKLFSM